MGIFDEFYRPSRVQIDDPEYPGAFARSYSRQMCSTTTISIMLCGAVLVIFGSWFVWYQYTSCGVFCVRLDGPQHTGEAHCPDGIPQTLGADGSVDATFEARLLEVADDIHVNHRIVLSTIWLPDGYARHCPTACAGKCDAVHTLLTSVGGCVGASCDAG